MATLALAQAEKTMPATSKVADALTRHEQMMLETLHKKDAAAFKKMVVYATTVWTNDGGTWMAVFHQESTAAKR